MTRLNLVCALLVLSALNLVLMVPGGFVETRTFPGYDVAVIAAFNIFLTCLGLGSLLLAYRIVRTGRIGVAPVLAGVSFVAVYVADLAVIFPISEVPMSALLETLEWIGTVLGLALLVTALQPAPAGETAAPARQGLPRGAVISLVVLALGIVTYATISAI